MMSDRAILEDIQSLQRHLEQSVGKLIADCSNLSEEAQREHASIREFTDQHNSAVVADIQNINELRSSLQTIGNLAEFRALLNKLPTVQDFLSRYEKTQKELQADLERYDNLHIKTIIDQCEDYRATLLKACADLANLRSFCEELLEAQHFSQELRGSIQQLREDMKAQATQFQENIEQQTSELSNQQADRDTAVANLENQLKHIKADSRDYRQKTQQQLDGLAGQLQDNRKLYWKSMASCLALGLVIGAVGAFLTSRIGYCSFSPSSAFCEQTQQIPEETGR
ncbi:MAG: hypothetical protein ACFB8W_15765 [Elainellaceae cyanobacterium]